MFMFGRSIRVNNSMRVGRWEALPVLLHLYVVAFGLLLCGVFVMVDAPTID
jgi:hypothetical protein